MKDFVYDALAGTDIFNQLYDTIADILVFSDADFSIASSIYGALLPLAYTLVLMYFLLELLEKTTHEQFNYEVFIKMFIKIMFVEVFMEYGPELISGFLSIGNWFVLEVKRIVVATTYQSGLIDEQLLRDTVDSMKFMEQLGALGMAIIIWVITAVVGLIMKVQCWAIKLELALRVALAPIALSDMFSDVARSTGIKYLKKILGVALQGGAICAIYAIGSGMQSTTAIEIVTEAGKLNYNAFFDMFVITFCLIGVTATTKQVVNDALAV